MEFDELLITTGVDALVRLIKEKKKIEVAITSQLLNIPSHTLEEWGHILEEEGIIKIEYSLSKVFFVWVEATAEQIATEKSEIYATKQTLEGEVKELRARVEPEATHLEEMKKDFSQLYDKLYPKFVEFENAVGALPGKGEVPAPYVENVKKMQERLAELEHAIASIRSDFEDVKGEFSETPKSIGKSAERVEALKKDFDRLKIAIADMKEKAKKTTSGLPVEMPSISEVKKKFESIRAEFATVKKVTATLHGDFQNLKEAGELISSVGTSIDKYEDDLAAAKKDVTVLAKMLDEVKTKSAALVEKVAEQKDLISHYSDSIDVAKNVLAKFPSQEKFSAKLRELLETQKDVGSKVESLDKLLSSVSGPAALTGKFDKLKGEIDSKLAEMEKEAQALSTAVDEESSTYATFQKIKERATVSMVAYNTQLKEMSAEIAKMKSEVGSLSTQFSESMKKYGDRFKQKDAQEIMQLAAGLKEKKDLLDEINESLDTLSNSSENLTKRLSLLSKQASMLEIRSGGGATQSSEQTKAEGEVRQQLELSKDEEVEFRQKREELRDLIKKLWEDGS